MRAATGFALTILAAVLAASVAAQGISQWPERLEDLVVPVDTTATIVLELGRADVRVRAGSPGRVRIRLQPLTGSGSDLPDPETLVEVAQLKSTVRITAIPQERARGVTLVLEIPARARLEVRLERGDIAVTGVSGTFDLSTSRGDIRLDDVGGSALADIRNGSIAASFRWLDPELPSAFATLNGNVDLALPPESALDLDVRCRGCTLGRVDLTGALQRTRLVAPADGEPILALYGPVGGGGALLQVFTWNGEVALRH